MASDEVMQGENAANIMNYALEGKGKVGVVFHDADFYVTNTRDKTFRETLKAKYPKAPAAVTKKAAAARAQAKCAA